MKKVKKLKEVKNEKGKNKNFNFIWKYIIFNIFLIFFTLFSLKYFENGLLFILTVGAYPLIEFATRNLNLDNYLPIILFLMWILFIFNFWFYLFIREKKGGRKKKILSFIIYLILMALSWFITIARSFASL